MDTMLDGFKDMPSVENDSNIWIDFPDCIAFSNLSINNPNW